MLVNARQRGDTIVEVLICIAIVAAVISGAYALASRSLQEGISAAEHADAIKLAEGQIEALKFRQAKTDSPANWNAYFTNNLDNSCLDISATSALDASGNVPANWKPYKNSTTNPEADLQKGAPGYDPVCVNSKTGTDKYFTNITAINNTSGSPTYLVTVYWIPVGGGPTSKSQLYYRF